MMVGGVASLPTHRGTEPQFAVYISGFRIVKDGGRHLTKETAPTRHCEYHVVVLLQNQQYECWQRFSSFKAIARNTDLGTSPSASAAWEAVRRCRPAAGGVLDPDHLSRKCLVLETFLRQLLGAFHSPGNLVDILARSSSRQPREHVSHAGRPWVRQTQRFGTAAASPLWVLARGIYS
ncbi:unnamed protein product [Choristocarpus tenellus]